MPTDEELISLGADALKGFTVEDDEGWGWPLSLKERQAAARRVINAIRERLNNANN